MTMNIESPSVSIVLIGQFQPQNFLPNALAEGKVITKKAAELASFIALIPNQTVQFKLDWGEVWVAMDRFQISTTDMPYIRACDFVLKAIGDLAPKSIVQAFGINVECHYDLKNVDVRNKIGTRLAPTEAWGSWGKIILESMQGEHKGTELQGGVIHLQMRQPFLDNGISGWRDMAVAPSNKIKNTGVIFKSNHHHQISMAESEGVELNEDAFENIKSQLLKRLSSVFEKSVADSLSIFQEVVSL